MSAQAPSTDDPLSESASASARAHGMGGRLFVISGPSGAGKTSLARALVDEDAGTRLSVSYTTREQRQNEIDGIHYRFVDDGTFAQMVESEAFLEHAKVFDHYYGTSKSNISQQLDAGLDVILEIDWQGARAVRRSWPSTLGIFVLPPSLDSLRARLRGRGQDSEQTIAARMEKAIAEISHHNEFDFLIVNSHFQTALSELRAIVTAARMSHGRQAGVHRYLLRELSRE